MRASLGIRAGLLISALALAACSSNPEGASAPNAASSREPSAEAKAQFQTALDDVYGRLEPLCPITKNPELLKWYDPARTRMRVIEANAARTPFEAIVNEEQEALRKRPVPECQAPDGPGTKAKVEKDFEALDPLLTKLESILRDYLTGA